LDIDSQGRPTIPVVHDEGGNVVAARWDQEAESSMELSPGAAADVAEHVFADDRPALIVLYGLRLQLAHHRHWGDRKAVKLLKKLIELKDPPDEEAEA
jgi:hypothetical protein